MRVEVSQILFRQDGLPGTHYLRVADIPQIDGTLSQHQVYLLPRVQTLLLPWTLDHSKKKGWKHLTFSRRLTVFMSMVTFQNLIIPSEYALAGKPLEETAAVWKNVSTKVVLLHSLPTEAELRVVQTQLCKPSVPLQTCLLSYPINCRSTSNLQS